MKPLWVVLRDSCGDSGGESYPEHGEKDYNFALACPLPERSRRVLSDALANVCFGWKGDVSSWVSRTDPAAAPTSVEDRLLRLLFIR